MAVFVLVVYHFPFTDEMPPEEQVSVIGVYKSEEAAEAALKKWNEAFDTPVVYYEVVPTILHE